MSAPRLCKYNCGKELYWDVAKSRFIEIDGTEHTKERCESLKKKPETSYSSDSRKENIPTTESDPMRELSQAIRELTAAIRERRL